MSDMVRMLPVNTYIAQSGPLLDGEGAGSREALIGIICGVSV